MPQSYTLPKIIAIVGPTASGKTELAIKLARKFKGEVVSADSRQIYRGMDIGTAKPAISHARRSRASAKSRVPSNDGTQISLISKGVPHYLIDIRNPNQSYTVAQYQADAIKAIKQILKSDKIPFLVGGTGLYVSAVLDNLEIPKVGPNQKLRAKLEKLMQNRGLPFLFKKLTKLDPEAAYIVDPKNPRRIIRALEVALTSGQPFTVQRKKGPKLFDELILGLNPPEAKSRKNIENRTKQMFQAGLVGEVKALIKKYGTNQAAFDAIGYREVIDRKLTIVNFRSMRKSLEQVKKQINQNTWRFAKRQMTWFRKMRVVWVKNQKEAEREITKFLTS